MASLFADDGPFTVRFFDLPQSPKQRSARPLAHAVASGTVGTLQLLDLDHGKLIVFDHIETVLTGTQKPDSTAKPGQPGGRESWCPGTLGLGGDGFRPERIRSTGVFIGARRLCKQPAGFHLVSWPAGACMVVEMGRKGVSHGYV